VLGNDIDFTDLPLTAILVAHPAHGSLTLSANGSFSYTPATNFFGTDSFTYQATDGIDSSNTATVTVTVTQVAQAKFLEEDTGTAGNWIGTYGSQGYDVINSGNRLPANVTVTAAHESLYTWANPAPTTATQALEVPPGGTSRIAACWYSSTSFTVDVNVATGSYNLELYLLDYDKQSRSEQIQLSDAGTGTVLSTETVSGFSGGAYLNWTISGNVLITITKLAGANAVLSGLFFDPASVSPSVVVGGGPLGPGGGIGAGGQAATNPITAIDRTSASLSLSSGETLAARGAVLLASGIGATSTQVNDDRVELGASNSGPAVAPQQANISVSVRELVNDVALELVAAGKPWTRARFGITRS
jgi:VCBS repeat-containing protein